MESIYENSKSSKQAILDEHKTTSIIQKITLENGIKLYIKGAQFPQKGCPTPEAILVVNTIKRILLSFLSSGLIPTSKHRLIRSFNKVTFPIISSFWIKDVYLTSFTRELKNLIFNFLINWNIGNEQAMWVAKTISHIFEYDNAYRYRLQDILGETSKEKLLLFKEIQRLAKIAYDRDDKLLSIKSKNRIGTQFRKVALVLAFIIYIPGVRKALKKALIQCNFNNFLMDESDRYWSYLRLDYDFGGLTYEKRMLRFKEWGFKLPE